MDGIAPGRVLNGKWTVGALLGKGGGGMVYDASHRNGIRAAVKILHPDLASDADRVARFLREGSLANHLEHVGAVVAFDDDRTEDGLVYVVFERLEGEPLSSIIEARAPLAPAFALAVADKILDVLVAAHRKGVLHRDVKPSNLFVLPDGSVKLLDFGLAKSAGCADPALVPTANGMVLGTPGYMSPEQARGETALIDERSDLWSVAAVLFTMLTRKHVHTGFCPREAISMPIRSVRSEVPDVVARVVDRGLSLEPVDRFQTAARMQSAVRFALSSLVDAPSVRPRRLACAKEASSSPPAPNRRAPVAWWTVMAGLCGVAALAGLAWLAFAVVRPEPRLPPTSDTRR